jgi:hypothetical protein
VGIVPRAGGDDVRIRALPGSVVLRQLVVINPTDEAQDVRFTALDAVTTEDGVFTLASDSAPRTGVGRWTSVPDGVLRVPAGGNRLAVIRIRVPRDARPGDHSGGVVARVSRPRTVTQGSIGVTIVERVGVRIHVRVPGPRDTGLAVERIALSTERGGTVREALGMPTAVRVRFVARNSGNVLQDEVTGVVRVMKGDTRVGEVHHRVGALLPGESRVLQDVVALPGLPQGDYRVEVDLTGLSEARASAAFAVAWRPLIEAGAIAALLVAIAGIWRWGFRRPV